MLMITIKYIATICEYKAMHSLAPGHLSQSICFIQNLSVNLSCTSAQLIKAHKCKHVKSGRKRGSLHYHSAGLRSGWGQLQYNDRRVNCRSTGREIDPAPGEWFIPQNHLISPGCPLARYSSQLKQGITPFLRSFIISLYFLFYNIDVNIIRTIPS